MILPLYILPVLASQLELVSDNARSPVNAKSLVNRPWLSKREPKTSSRWSSTETLCTKQLSPPNMPTLKNSRNENFRKSSNDIEKKIDTLSQPIRIPVRQRSKKSIHDDASHQRRNQAGILRPQEINWSDRTTPRLQGPCKQQASTLRIPIRQLSNECLTVEPEQMIYPRDISNKTRITAKLLSQVLEQFSGLPINETS